MLNNLPNSVTVYEVGMRDGLQNEPEYIPLEEKITLINMLSATGLKHIEITSFVSPKWIPQLQDNSQVAEGIRRQPGVSYSALVPNERGLESALAADVPVIGVFLSASEGHNRKNINKSKSEALAASLIVAAKAKEKGHQVRAYLSTVFGCPFDGQVDPGNVKEMVQQLLSGGVDQVSLGDTIGVANPKQVQEVIRYLVSDIPAASLALHFHDTRGLGLANVLAGLEWGITTLDSSFGGLGGCPYAPGASGNIATEDLLYLLHSMGIKTGVDLDKLVACSKRVENILGRKLPSKVLQAY